jgi:hypothetical protein
MRIALRLFVLDQEGALYRLPSATFDRMREFPNRHRIPQLAGQRVRHAEVLVEMVNGQPHRALRSTFSMLTFEADGTLVPPLQDRHVRATIALALAPLLEAPTDKVGISDATTRFLARGGQWTPSASLQRRIERAALGREKCPRISPSGPASE